MRSVRATWILAALMSLFATSLLASGNSHQNLKGTIARTGETGAWIPTANLNEKWQVQLAEPGGENQGETLGSAQIVVANNVVYVRWINKIYAYNRTDGSAYWNSPYQNNALIGGDLGLTYDSGILYLPGGQGNLIALDAQNQSEKWTYSSSSGKTWSAIVEGDRIYFVSGKDLVCLNKSSGSKIWSYSNGQTGVLAHVAKQGNALVYSTASSYNPGEPIATTLVAVDASNGAQLWQTGGQDIRMTLALTSKHVISGTVGATFGHNLTDGSKAWQSFGPKKIEHNQGGGGIIVSEDDGIYIALSEGVKSTRGGGFGFADNDERWFPTFTRYFMSKYGNVGDPWACQPAIGETALGKVFVGVDKYGTLLINDLASGNTIMEYHFYREGQPGISRYGYKNVCSPALLDGDIFVALGDGKVRCLSGTVKQNESRGPAKWQVQEPSETVDAIFDVHFSDDQNGVAVTKGKVLTTSNGGATWNPQSLSGTNDWFHSVVHRGGSNWTALGQYGSILTSSNGGASWSLNKQRLGKHSGRALYFIDQNTGWLAGHNGFIMKTTNGGQSWTLQQGTTDDNQPENSLNLEDIVFANADLGIAVGMGGLIQRTTNGGGSWQTIETDWAVAESNNDLFGIAMADAQTVIAVGALGRIRKSSDGGQTWRDIPSPVSYTLYDVQFLNAQEGYASGTYGTMLYSNDAGETWSPQATGTTAPLYRVHFVDDTHGWAAAAEASRGLVLHTNQRGTATGIKANEIAIEMGYSLSAAYPNPFARGGTSNLRLHFGLPQNQAVRIAVYNILGQEVYSAAPRQYAAGSHGFSWNGLDRGRPGSCAWRVLCADARRQSRSDAQRFGALTATTTEPSRLWGRCPETQLERHPRMSLSGIQ